MQNTSFLNNVLQGISKRSTKLFQNPYRQVNIGPIKHKYLKHLPPGKLREHAMGNGVIHYINAQELLHGLKEIFIDEIYKMELPTSAYIIDCGANIGLSVIYIKQLCPDAVIIAFEPDQSNFKLLEQNIESYGIKNVQVEQKAVWKENTTIAFANEGSMSSRIEQSSSTTEDNKVIAVRLKEYLNENVDFLKIDIEGAEYQVLKDIEPNLHFVQKMFLEYHGNFDQNNELVEIFDILKETGFRFYIKEAANIYQHPFVFAQGRTQVQYDVQLNIFCFRPE
jgi:FkbM family methyltransferase